MKPRNAGTTEDLPTDLVSLDPSDNGRGFAAIDVPELGRKPKEKERKGAGAPWIWSEGAPSGGVLGSGGIRVAAGMSETGVLGSGRVAAALARLFGGPGTFLGGFFASKFGSVMVLAGLAAWAGIMVAAAVKLFGGIAEPSASAPAPLPGIGSSGIVIDAPKDNSLGYVANANQGEIEWDKAKAKDAPAEAKKADAPAAPEADKLPEAPKTPDLTSLMGAAAQKPGGLNRDGFLAKLTNDASSLHGGLGMRDSLNAMKPIKTFASAGLPKAVQLGKTSSMKRAMEALRAGHRSTLSASAQRAMGQLKFSKGMSATAGNAKMDAQARQYATDAFEQGKTVGSSLGGVGDGGGIVVPPGDGAPGVTDVSPPDVSPGQNVTPYQPQVDNAKNADNNSGMLKMLGMMLLAIGAILLALGMALMGNPMTAPIGAMLAALGAMLLALGAMMLGQSGDQANQAKNQGKQIQQQYGQDDQGSIVDQCADQAYENGTQSEACQTGTSGVASQKAASNNVHEAVQNEANATYTLNGGNGQEAKAVAK